MEESEKLQAFRAAVHQCLVTLKDLDEDDRKNAYVIWEALTKAVNSEELGTEDTNTFNLTKDSTHTEDETIDEEEDTENQQTEPDSNQGNLPMVPSDIPLTKAVPEDGGCTKSRSSEFEDTGSKDEDVVEGEEDFDFEVVELDIDENPHLKSLHIGEQETVHDMRDDASYTIKRVLKKVSSRTEGTSSDQANTPRRSGRQPKITKKCAQHFAEIRRMQNGKSNLQQKSSDNGENFGDIAPDDIKFVEEIGTDKISDTNQEMLGISQFEIQDDIEKNTKQCATTSGENDGHRIITTNEKVLSSSSNGQPPKKRVKVLVNNKTLIPEGFLKGNTVCPLCKKKFSTTGNLKTHMRIHSKSRPFKCKICPDRAFTTAQNLQRHYKYHNKDFQYQCSFCDKAFVEKRSLVTHERVHTGERPFKCTQCPKSFAQSCALRAHEPIHLDVKIFICDLCGNSFKQKSVLMIHRRRRHGVQKVNRDSVPLVPIKEEEQDIYVRKRQPKPRSSGKSRASRYHNNFYQGNGSSSEIDFINFQIAHTTKSRVKKTIDKNDKRLNEKGPMLSVQDAPEIQTSEDMIMLVHDDGNVNDDTVYTQVVLDDDKIATSGSRYPEFSDETVVLVVDETGNVLDSGDYPDGVVFQDDTGELHQDIVYENDGSLVLGLNHVYKQEDEVEEDLGHYEIVPGVAEDISNCEIVPQEQIVDVYTEEVTY